MDFQGRSKEAVMSAQKFASDGKTVLAKASRKKTFSAHNVV